MDPLWQIELFGGLRAIRGDQIVTRFRTQKTASLIAYLAFYSHRSHFREELIELLWPACDPPLGRRSLRTALYSLRHQLEPPGIPPAAVIVADRRFVRLNAEACVTDVAQFETALQAAFRVASGEEQRQRLEEATALYRGELLPGSFDDWVLIERARLAEQFQQALHQLAALAEADGDFPTAIRWAHRAIATDPRREEGCDRLIRLLAADGRREAALRVYRELERRHAQEPDDCPAPELTALAAALARGREGGRGNAHEAAHDRVMPVRAENPGASAATDRSAAVTPREPSHPIAPTTSQAPARSPSSPGNLPRQFTQFFGREREVAHLRELLRGADNRLVTLIGPGGVGKTRLSLRAAEELRHDFPGGVWFVPLLDLADPSLIMAKVLQQLQAPDQAQGDPVDRVAAALGSQPCLLVLDNFEQLVEGGAEPLQRLRERTNHLSLLVTSRRQLGLAGEQIVIAEPLPVPDVPAMGRSGDGATRPDNRNAPSPEHLNALLHCPSVALFRDRAQAVRPDFQVTPANAGAVAALCRELGGLPLALELAAARAGVLTPQQMLEHIRDQRDLLVSRQRVADPRHRSLRVCPDWSYQQLPPPLKRFFARLSVFRGGCTLEAAAALCFDFERGILDLGLLGQVEDAQLPDTPSDLIRCSKSPIQNEKVLEALEELRERSLIAAEPAGEAMRYRFLEVVRQYAVHHLQAGGDEAQVRARHLEFFTALAEEAEAKIPCEAGRTWLDRCEIEHDNLRAALDWAAEDGNTEKGLRLGTALYRFWRMRSHPVEGRERLTRLLALPEAMGASSVRARALDRTGRLAYCHGDPELAWALSEESLAISRAREDRGAIAVSLGHLGYLAHMRDDYETAQPLIEESLAIRRELGDLHDLAQALNELGGLSYRQGLFEAAARFYEEAVGHWRWLGRRADTSHPLYNRGLVALHQGDAEMARHCFSECLAIAQELGDTGELPHLLDLLGGLAYEAGDFEAAQECFEESLAIYRDQKQSVGIARLLNRLARLAYLRNDANSAAVLREESLTLARAAGRDWLIAQTLAGLGEIACERNDPAAAQGFFREGLARFREVPDPPGLQRLGPKNRIIQCLEGLAAVSQLQDDPTRAARLLGAAEALHQSIGASRPLPEQPAYERLLAAVCGAHGEAAFAAACAEGRAMSQEQVEEYALA